MVGYLLRKTFGWIVLIVVATNLVFFLASALLQPRANYLSRRPPLPESVVESTLDRYNLND